MIDKLHKINYNWLIQTKIDLEWVTKFKGIIDSNYDSFYKSNISYSISSRDSNFYWIYDAIENPKFYQKEVEDSVSFITDTVKKTLKSNDITSNIILDSIWSIKSRGNTYNYIHDHPIIIDRKNIKGVGIVLYLDIPENFSESNSNSDGNIYFVLNSDFSENPNSPKVIEVKPSFGDLLIFPNWILHGSYPHEGIRQTFNINYKCV